MKFYKRGLLRLIEASGGLSLLRWKNRFVPQVLMFHRIIKSSFINGLAPDEFEKQITYVKKNFRLVPIETLLSEVSSNQIKPYTMAITFDDGHQDFYYNAWPILKKHHVPASLYVTTGFVNNDTWLWPDLLKYVILNAKNKSIDIFPIGALSLAEIDVMASWHILGDFCLTLPETEREQFIKKIAMLTDINPPPAPVPPFLPVTWDQLREMVADGLDVGSHTITHPILNSINPSRIHEELAGSATMINNNLNIIPKGICYPNGRLSDINDLVIQQAAQIGYRYGLLARNHPISSNAPFLIGRLPTHDDFDYFKWIVSHRSTEHDSSYLN